MPREARDREPGDERGDAEALARGLLELPTRVEERCRVDVHPHRRLGDLAAGPREVRRGRAAHAIQRHATVAGGVACSRGRRMPRHRRRPRAPARAPCVRAPPLGRTGLGSTGLELAHERLDVAAQHEVVGAGSVELARVEAVLARDAAHDRRDDGGSTSRIEARRSGCGRGVARAAAGAAVADRTARAPRRRASSRWWRACRSRSARRRIPRWPPRWGPRHRARPPRVPRARSPAAPRRSRSRTRMPVRPRHPSPRRRPGRAS